MVGGGTVGPGFEGEHVAGGSELTVKVVVEGGVDGGIDEFWGIRRFEKDGGTLVDGVVRGNVGRG